MSPRPPRYTWRDEARALGEEALIAREKKKFAEFYQNNPEAFQRACDVAGRLLESVEPKRKTRRK